MALFEFDLARVEDIVPWGDPGNKSLSWFALTDGFFRMVVGGQILFRYTEGILRHWGQADQDAGYQIAALARDVLGSVAAGTASLPPFVERLAADWELLTRLRTRCSEFEGASTSADDMRYNAWRWLGERSPCASYLVEEPNLSFVRIGDNVHIHWDNRDRVIDGIRVWTAQYGVHKLPVDVFLAECRDFAARLVGEMGVRIFQIEAGLAVPQVAVDIASLREQQEVWRIEFESYFKADEPDVPWEDAEVAVRAMAKGCGIDLPA